MVSKNVLHVFPRSKGARRPLVEQAEPCNHKQMTELPGSDFEKPALIPNTSLHLDWTKSSSQKNCHGLPGIYQFSDSRGPQFTGSVRRHTVLSLVF